MSKLTTYNSIGSFLTYMRRYKWRVLLIMLFYMLANVFTSVIPIFVGKLVGTVAHQPVDSHLAYRYVYILAVLSMGHSIFWHGSEYIYMKVMLPMIYSYENVVFKQVIQKPYPFFVDKFTGKISSYITTLGDEFRNFIDNIYYNYASMVVQLFTVSAILLSINWQTGLIFVGNLFLMLFVGRYTVRNNIIYEKRLTDIASTKNGKIIDAVANFVNVKSFRKEAVELQTIKSEQLKTIKAGQRSFFWSLAFWVSMSFVVRFIIWPATILLNVWLYLHHRITLTELATFLSSVLLFTNYIWGIIWNISQFNLKIAKIEESYQYLFGPVNIVRQYYEETTRPVAHHRFNRSLEFSGLHFAYPDKSDDAVLRDIRLKIKKGEKLGIVGKSGSGKTTLTKLLLGYYLTDSKEILLDNEPVDNRDLAQLISYVPQDTSLFHRSIADNIAYATEQHVTRQEIVTAAKRAHADEFIRLINEGYEALVGERGVKLSAGQRQRIAIARAFLDDKPILILDEATSALDSESELLVQKALEELWHDKTVLAIAHRLSTLRNMDRIIVLDKGRIIEEGSHQELLNKKGHYAKLWAHQSGGFLSDE